MLLSLLVIAQVASVSAVATCRAPNDAQERTWILERRDGRAWRIAFTARSLDTPRVTLPLPNASPAIGRDEIRLSYKSANGGRTVDWRIVNGPSTLDLYVSHGLEVNVEADLDPAVDLMNTEGPIPVMCAIAAAPLKGAPYDRETGGTPNDRGPPLSGAPSDEGLPNDRGAALSGVPSDEGSPNDRRAPLSGVPSEWMMAIGAARSVNLFESTGGRAYAVQTIAWGRDLTRELGPGALRGRFAWAVEVMPVFAQFEPDTIYGFGIAPVVWRWNFVPQPRWSAFAELSMGGVWTTDPIPEDTGTANFTAHWGGGVRFLPRGRQAWLVGYRFQHFSNGNQLGSNPGVNSHVVLVGWTYRK